MKDILNVLENKEIAIYNSINEVDIQISDCERRKKYLEGRLYEVRDILESVKKEMNKNDKIY